MSPTVVRLFNVYYPLRSLVLLCGEAFIICSSFLLASRIEFGADSYLVLYLENGYYKILAVTGLALICSHYFDLYDPARLAEGSSLIYFRLLVVLGTFSIILAALGLCFPRFTLGKHALLLGLIILTFALITWRSSYGWLIRRPYLTERIYVLGGSKLAHRLVEAISNRPDLGMEVAGWAETLSNELDTRKTLESNIAAVLKNSHQISRIVLAMPDRRGTIPVRQLLTLRLRGVGVEDATSFFEKITGKIEIEDLHPSWLILSDGFRSDSAFVTRAASILISLALLALLLPLLLLIALAIKATSPGPVLYRQKRVGRNDAMFTCYKFRTMRADAEAGTGPVWAGEHDPRITSMGRILRKARLDEIPQLWNVVKGDMALVGPRPERPEFVKWLSTTIPYYTLRHAIRPGITGWAQVNYRYGSSVEDAQEKLKYDLFYIKNMSLGLDLVTLLYTTKVVFLGRGAQ